MSTNKKFFNLILITSILLKIVIVIFYHEKQLSDEWAVLLNNLEELKIISFYNIDGQYIPSSYMPPLYLIFLYCNKLLSFQLFNFIYLVYFFQIFLSTISVVLFYNLCNIFFNKNLSLFGLAIFAFFPLLMLCNGLISSASLQVFLYLLFISYSLKIIADKKKPNLIIFSLICSSCLLLRGEFLVVFIASLIFFVLINKKNLIYSLILLVLSTLIISPYIYRNYLNSNEVHIVNSKGYALWRGNNHLSKVESTTHVLHPNERNTWPDIYEFKELYENLDNIEVDRAYESNRDKVFFEEAINNISNNPKKYFNLYIKKILSYYFIDLNSSINNYYNPLHILPVIFISIFSLPGVILSLQKRDTQQLYLLIIMTILTTLISIFFILPRYKISIIIFQIIFCLLFFEYCYKKIKK